MHCYVAHEYRAAGAAAAVSLRRFSLRSFAASARFFCPATRFRSAFARSRSVKSIPVSSGSGDPALEFLDFLIEGPGVPSLSVAGSFFFLERLVSLGDAVGGIEPGRPCACLDTRRIDVTEGLAAAGFAVRSRYDWMNASRANLDQKSLALLGNRA